MEYNTTTEVWTSVLPGQSNSSNLVEFQLSAYDIVGNVNQSSIYTYPIKPVIQGDVNGDGKVGVKDIALVAIQYGKIGP